MSVTGSNRFIERSEQSQLNEKANIEADGLRHLCVKKLPELRWYRFGADV